jgi:hypothetical protein
MADSSVKLLAYKHVAPGFETVINDQSIGTGRTWNLWFNTNLSDDPEKWDDQIIGINRLQGKLGNLDPDHRLIRAHIAEFCRANPLFPESVSLICQEIGSECLSNPAFIGCEGRNLLNMLGFHNQENGVKQQKDLLKKYAVSLGKWLLRSNPESPIDFKVSGFLGKPTDSKENVISELVMVMKSDSVWQNLRKFAEKVCSTTLMELDNKRSWRPFACFGCQASSDQNCEPACGCCLTMLIDAVMLSVGAKEDGRKMFGEFSLFVQENVLASCIAVNSWLEGRFDKSAIPFSSLRYQTEQSVHDFGDKIATSLDEKTKTKEWLASCLLKTLKNNQRWHGVFELIDDIPQATSWLNRISLDE